MKEFLKNLESTQSKKIFNEKSMKLQWGNGGLRSHFYIVIWWDLVPFPHCNFMDFSLKKNPDYVDSRFFKNSFIFGRPPRVMVSKNTSFQDDLAYRKFRAIWECLYGGITNFECRHICHLARFEAPPQGGAWRIVPRGSKRDPSRKSGVFFNPGSHRFSKKWGLARVRASRF